YARKSSPKRAARPRSLDLHRARADKPRRLRPTYPARRVPSLRCNNLAYSRRVLYCFALCDLIGGRTRGARAVIVFAVTLLQENFFQHRRVDRLFENLSWKALQAAALYNMIHIVVEG